MYGIYENGKVIAQFTAPLSLVSNQPVFQSDTLSLKRFVVKRSAQRWELETGVEPLIIGAGDLMVSLVTKAYDTPVTIVTPQNYGVKKARTNTLTPTASGAFNANSVSISGANGRIPAGTFVKFSTHSKVYMTTTEFNGDFTSGTIGVYPRLRAAVTSTAMQCNDDVLMTCYYDTDVVQGMQFSDGILMNGGTIKFVEKV